MTPKLYLDVAKKLADVWGPYAGWAHSVSSISQVAYQNFAHIKHQTGSFHG